MHTNHCQTCGKEFRSTRKRATCPGKCTRIKENVATNIAWHSGSTQRRRAHGLVKKALKLRQLAAQPCEVCGTQRAQAHHDDYAAPLDVRWLCPSHHRDHHNEFGPGKNSYSTQEGETA